MSWGHHVVDSMSWKCVVGDISWKGVVDTPNRTLSWMCVVESPSVVDTVSLTCVVGLYRGEPDRGGVS